MSPPHSRRASSTAPTRRPTPSSTLRRGSSPTSTTAPSPRSATSTTSSARRRRCSTSWARGSPTSATAPAHLTVLGMNAAGARRPTRRPTATVVHDLNADPQLPFADDVVRRRGLLRVGRLPHPTRRGVHRRRARRAARRAVRVHVLEPLLPDQGDPGLARVHRRAALRDRRRLLPAAPAAGTSRSSSDDRSCSSSVIRCSRYGRDVRLLLQPAGELIDRQRLRPQIALGAYWHPSSTSSRACSGVSTPSATTSRPRSCGEGDDAADDRRVVARRA